MRAALFVMVIVAAPALALHGQAVKPAALSHSARQSSPGAARDDSVSVPREAIRDAMTFLGVPYVSGGITRTGLDCSGLVYRVLQDAAGMDVPRGVEALFRSGTPVTYPMHIGDLVFFDTETKGPPSVPCHVGIYAGRGRFIHAASEGSRTGVIVSPLDSPYYRERFLGARRIIPWRAAGPGCRPDRYPAGAGHGEPVSVPRKDDHPGDQQDDGRRTDGPYDPERRKEGLCRPHCSRCLWPRADPAHSGCRHLGRAGEPPLERPRA